MDRTWSQILDQSRSYGNLIPEGIDGQWENMSDELRTVIGGLIRAKSWPIYIFGDQGRGKTFAMASVMKQWIGCAMWIDLQPWMKKMMSKRMSPDEPHEETRILNAIQRTSLLCIDDCGIRIDSDAQHSLLLEILNLRTGKPTIITGNYDPGYLPKIFDSRVASRMLAGSAIKILGKDRRLVGAKVIEANG